jgi:hypothetical protein
VTQLPTNLALVGADLSRGTAHEARQLSKRRRRRVLAVGLAVLVLAVTGVSALAGGWLEGAPAIPATAATGGLSALLAQPAGAAPSARVLRVGAGFGVSSWHRVPAVEAYLGVDEVDVGETPDGRVCLEMIASGFLQPGTGGCLRALKPGGDMQSLVWTAVGQPVRILGVVPDSVRAVSVQADSTSTAAYLADDIVAWVAPVAAPTETPVGATITLMDGTTLMADAGMSVR